MKSPQHQKIIQIEVTNACVHSCANCTRFCGHHKKPHFMDLTTFEIAAASLTDYPGLVGVMGGEPTIHPQFDDITRAFVELRPERRKVSLSRGVPIEDFNLYRNSKLSNLNCKRGLWTSLGAGYRKHYELIQESYPYQCINDHANAGLHQALLITRKELGIPDDEWELARDRCWVQNLWSSSITKKGAFFCEVAAALDMLFDGPGGWDVEPGWWQRKPKDFGSQLEWCEMCSACLPVPRVPANAEIDIVSPAMQTRLAEIESPKLRKDKVKVFDCATYSPEQYQDNKDNAEWYLEDNDNSKRVSVDTSKDLYKRKISAVTACVGYDDYLNITLPHNVKHFDEFIVVTSEADKLTQEVAHKHGAKVVVCNRIHSDGAPFRKGAAINGGIQRSRNDWVLIMDADIVLPEHFSKRLDQYVLNPGYLYYTKRWGPKEDNFQEFVKQMNEGLSWHDLYHAYANRKHARKTDRLGNDIEHFPYGYFQLFNKRASVLKECDGLQYYDETSRTAENADMYFGMHTYKGKTESLPLPDFDVIHLPHGAYKRNWSGRVSPRVDHIQPTERLLQFGEIAVVACHYQLPIRRLWEFCLWNWRVFEEHGVKLYVVTDCQKDMPAEWAECICIEPLQTYSPARASNIGIRTAVEAHARVVVKTDIDCVLTHSFMQKVAVVSNEHGLAPYYMMADEYTDEALDKARPWTAGVGTLAITSEVWKKTCGYDERMEGYGREDGEGYERAAQHCRIKRDEGLLYHIAHEKRFDDKDKFYPLRRRINMKLPSKQGTWKNEDWGIQP